MAVDPLEPLAAEVQVVEGGHVAVQPVEVGDEPAYALVLRAFEQEPVGLAGEVPLPSLRELAAHEQELLAGVGEHVGVEQAHGGELLPPVSGHAFEHGTLAVHHLVVGEG